jgi:hypothetical protein
MKRFYNLLVILFVFAIAVNAKNYYISSSTGNDTSGDGSKTKPYKSFIKFDTSNTLNLAGGDSILLMGGDTFNSTLTIYANGTPTADIVISSYANVVGGETNNAVIKITSSSANGIFTYGSFLTIRDLIITGPWDQYNATGSTATGIGLAATSSNVGSVAVIGCDVSGFNWGINAYYSNIPTKNVFTTVNLMYNYVHDCGKAGIDISAGVPSSDNHIYAYGNLICYKNYIYNNLAGTCTDPYKCGHNGDGAVFGSFAKGCMSHNVVFHNGWLNKSIGAGPAGFWVWDSDSVIMEYNEAYDCGTKNGAGDGDAFDLDGGVTNTILQYNYSHDNWAAGYLVWEYGSPRVKNSNNTIRYNISENDNLGYPDADYNRKTFAGITISPSSCKGTKVYNNTVSSKNGPCLRVNASSTATDSLNRFYNNILYSTATPYSGVTLNLIEATGSRNVFLNNLYYSTQGNVSINSAGSTYTNSNITSFDSKALTGNPLLKNPVINVNFSDFTANTNLTNYQLQTGSPAKDKGLDLTASPYNWNVGKTDYNGLSNPAGTGYDIGACEAR